MDINKLTINKWRNCYYCYYYKTAFHGKLRIYNLWQKFYHKFQDKLAKFYNLAIDYEEKGFVEHDDFVESSITGLN